ncbi:hypothetical protein ACFWDG_14400 [Peribacillus sp. NPDC060186]
MKEAVIDYLIIVMLIIAFTYGLIRQIRQIVGIRKGNQSDYVQYKRIVAGNYLSCLSYTGFLIAYILNVLLASDIIPPVFFTSDNTSFSCFIFLALLLIANFGIIPKESNHVDLQK